MNVISYSESNLYSIYTALTILVSLVSVFVLTYFINVNDTYIHIFNYGFLRELQTPYLVFLPVIKIGILNPPCLQKFLTYHLSNLPLLPGFPILENGTIDSQISEDIKLKVIFDYCRHLMIYAPLTISTAVILVQATVSSYLNDKSLLLLILHTASVI